MEKPVFPQQITEAAKRYEAENAAAKRRVEAPADSRPLTGSASLPAGTELEREMTSLFEEWWVKDRTPWMHANKDGARFLFTMAFLAGRESQRKQPAMTLNDPSSTTGAAQ